MLTYTDEQALGYLIMALKNLGKSEKEIREIIYKVKYEMETWTEQYAEEAYEDFI